MLTMAQRILHLDMDAFYASVEVLDNPKLAGKPLLVGGRGPRAVVAACSYEARKFGVHSAMPMRRARELCRKAVVVKPRTDRYRDVSELIFQYVCEQAPLVERMSVDEAYLDISHKTRSDAEALELGKRLKKEIRGRFGLICSIGIAPCKFAAKIASDIEKPDALVLVSEKDLLSFLAPLSVECIPGVGKIGLKKLQAIGVRTIADLRSQHRGTLTALFGRWGMRLYDFARGIDPRPVVTEHEQKSLGTELTFDEDVRDWETLCSTLEHQSARLAAVLRETKRQASTVMLKVRYATFEEVKRQQSFSTPLQDAREIRDVAQELLKRTEADQRPVRLLGIALSGFQEPQQPGELPLFEQ